MKTSQYLVLVYVIAATLAMSTVGCASVGAYEEKLQAWVGHDEGALISQWGAPDSVYSLASGGKVVTYNKASSSSSSVRHNAFLKTSYVSTRVNSCTTSFTLDASGTITKWSHQGNSCKSR